MVEQANGCASAWGRGRAGGSKHGKNECGEGSGARANGSELGGERVREGANAWEKQRGGERLRGGERARASNMKIKRLTYTGACVFLNCHILNVAQSIKCLREKKPYQMSHLGKCGHLAERIACFGLPGLWMATLSTKKNIVDQQKNIF